MKEKKIKEEDQTMVTIDNLNMMIEEVQLRDLDQGSISQLITQEVVMVKLMV
jgi:hypothetical protein